MEKTTADMLNELNKRFYAQNAESFARTRQGGWPGWGRAARHMAAHVEGRQASILDLACGNMRFEHWLTSSFPNVDFDFWCLDSCEDLAGDKSSAFVHFTPFDAYAELACADQPIPVPTCDAAVCFGYLHHVPGFENRSRVLRFLLASVRPGGVVAVSLWQFMNDAGLAKKALATTESAQQELGFKGLEPGDYLLGWQNRPSQYRYCHSFSNPEVDGLAESVADVAQLIERFVADGRTQNLNTYLVFARL